MHKVQLGFYIIDRKASCELLSALRATLLTPHDPEQEAKYSDRDDPAEPHSSPDVESIFLMRRFIAEAAHQDLIEEGADLPIA